MANLSHVIILSLSVFASVNALNPMQQPNFGMGMQNMPNIPHNGAPSFPGQSNPSSSNDPHADYSRHLKMYEELKSAYEKYMALRTAYVAEMSRDPDFKDNKETPGNPNPTLAMNTGNPTMGGSPMTNPFGPNNNMGNPAMGGNPGNSPFGPNSNMGGNPANSPFGPNSNMGGNPANSPFGPNSNMGNPNTLGKAPMASPFGNQNMNPTMGNPNSQQQKGMGGGMDSDD